MSHSQLLPEALNNLFTAMAGLLAHIMSCSVFPSRYIGTVTFVLSNLNNVYSSGNCPRISRGSLFILIRLSETITVQVYRLIMNSPLTKVFDVCSLRFFWKASVHRIHGSWCWKTGSGLSGGIGLRARHTPSTSYLTSQIHQPKIISIWCRNLPLWF